MQGAAELMQQQAGAASGQLLRKTKPWSSPGPQSQILNLTDPDESVQMQLLKARPVQGAAELMKQQAGAASLQARPDAFGDWPSLSPEASGEIFVGSSGASFLA